MPSSKFTMATKAKLPVVCHKELELDEPTDVNGAPLRLSAYASWTQLDPDYDLAESFSIFFDAAANAWTGASSDTGLNLHLTVHPLPSPNHYTFELSIRVDQDPYDQVDWGPIEIEPPPPFDSGLLLSHYPPPYPWTELRVID